MSIYQPATLSLEECGKVYHGVSSGGPEGALRIVGSTAAEGLFLMGSGRRRPTVADGGVRPEMGLIRVFTEVSHL